MSNSDRSRRVAPVAVDQCGAALASKLLADRWTLLIVREVFYGVKRYDDIRADIGIPRSVLTARLKLLVDAGIFLREPYQEEGSRTRFAYDLSAKGKELGLTILALMQWGDKHLKDGKAAIEVKDRASGKQLQVGLVSDETAITPLSEVRLEIKK